MAPGSVTRPFDGTRRTLWWGALCLAVMLAAVGVGSANQPVAAESEDETPVSAVLTIVHGAPGERFDVYVGSELVASDAQFSSLHPGITLEAGRHKIAIREAGARKRSTPIAKVRLSVKSSDPLTVVVHLDEDGAVDLYKRKVNTKWVNGEARLMVRHLAEAPEIQLRYDGGLKHRGIKSGQTRKSVVPALPFELGIFGQGDGELQPILNPVTVRLAENTVTVVYVVGSEADGTLQTLSHAYRTASN